MTAICNGDLIIKSWENSKWEKNTNRDHLNQKNEVLKKKELKR